MECWRKERENEMAVSDGGGLGDDRLSPVRTPALHGVKPGYGCLTCPLPSCHGCVKVMPTREEAVMLHCGGAGGGRNEKSAQGGGNRSKRRGKGF